MAAEPRTFQVELTPYTPDSTASIRGGIDEAVREALEESGQQNLLADDAIRIEVEENFPDGGVVVVLVTIATHVAAQVWDDIVWPRIVERWNARLSAKHDSEDNLSS